MAPVTEEKRIGISRSAPALKRCGLITRNPPPALNVDTTMVTLFSRASLCNFAMLHGTEQEGGTLCAGDSLTRQYSNADADEYISAGWRRSSQIGSCTWILSAAACDSSWRNPHQT